MVRYFTILLLFVSSQAIYGQNYNETDQFLNANRVWVFGQNMGLDFNSDPPSTLSTAIQSQESSASVADSAGRLLFYLGSDGTIWNRDHLPMQNGTGLLPYHPQFNGSSSAQGVVIVPFIDTPWKYYVFINTPKEGYEAADLPPYLTYSVVDMTLDNGRGGVESGRKNLPVYNYALAESMIAIPGNNCDVWLIAATNQYPGVITKDPNLPDDSLTRFLAWHITDQGIDPNPVVSLSHSFIINDGRPSLNGSRLAVSTDRKKIAWSVGNNIGVFLGKFNPETGEVSDGIVFTSGDIYTASYGVCFSPDGTKLYASHLITGIEQFDISVFDSAAISNSLYVLPLQAFTPKLYNDAVYAISGEGLAKINKPNEAGAACDLQAGFVVIPPGAYIGLPTEVVFPFRHEITVTNDNVCPGKFISAPEGFLYYEWNDGVATYNKQISESGTYWVKYFDRKCLIYIDTFHVTLLDMSQPEITVDTLILGTTLPYTTYQWMLNGAIIPGATDSIYTVPVNGEYQVICTNEDGCIDTSEIYLVTNVPSSISDTEYMAKRIKIYPNPVYDIMYITSPVPVNISILSLEGRVLQSAHGASSIITQDLSEGLYLLSIKDRSGRLLKVEKFIKINQ